MTRVVPRLHERHAPIGLQNAFFDALEAFEEWEAGAREPAVDLEGSAIPVSSIFGRMRTSEDLVPQKVELAFRSAVGEEEVAAAPNPLTYSYVAARMRELSLERLRYDIDEQRAAS